MSELIVEVHKRTIPPRGLPQRCHFYLFFFGDSALELWNCDGKKVIRCSWRGHYIPKMAGARVPCFRIWPYLQISKASKAPKKL